MTRFTWLMSWWGWSRGSVRDRVRELELRFNAWFRLEFPLGYLKEADRSNGAAPPFCNCCWKSIAAANACSLIRFPSFLEDRILMLPPPPPRPTAAASEWFVIRFDGGLFFAVDLLSRDKHNPILSLITIRSLHANIELWDLRVIYIETEREDI